MLPAARPTSTAASSSGCSLQGATIAVQAEDGGPWPASCAEARSALVPHQVHALTAAAAGHRRPPLALAAPRAPAAASCHLQLPLRRSTDLYM